MFNMQLADQRNKKEKAHRWHKNGCDINDISTLVHAAILLVSACRKKLDSEALRADWTEDYISDSNAWRRLVDTHRPPNCLRSTPTAANWRLAPDAYQAPWKWEKLSCAMDFESSKRLSPNVLTREPPTFFFLKAIFLNENIFRHFPCLYFRILVLVSMPLTIFNCWWTMHHLVNLCWRLLVVYL